MKSSTWIAIKQVYYSKTKIKIYYQIIKALIIILMKSWVKMLIQTLPKEFYLTG